MASIDRPSSSSRPRLDPALLAFRPLAHADLPQLHAWFEAPHARASFGGRTLDDVTEEYASYIDGRIPIHPFLVTLAGRPIGMLCWERVGDFPDLARNYEIDDPEAVNCDVVIGEADVAHRGLGAPMIRRFLRELVFTDARVTTCVIDPHETNTIAVRAYEKAGFRPLRTVVDAEDGCTRLALMELSRAELFDGPV